jgi:hypothetical protein
MTIMATSIYVTGNYHTDLKSARALGIVTGISPKADQLYDLIDNYNIKQISEFQKDREMALLDELINACNNGTESDTSDRSSLLPKPILKANKKPVPMPVKKNNQFRIKPDTPKLKTKSPVNIDTVLRRKPAPPRLKGSGDIMLPKLGNRFNRSIFQ